MKKTIVLALTAFSFAALPLTYAGDKTAKAGHQCEKCEGKKCKHKKGKKHDCKECEECSAHKADGHKHEGGEAPAAAPEEASH
jgi:hypothetical protein